MNEKTARPARRAARFKRDRRSQEDALQAAWSEATLINEKSREAMLAERRDLGPIAAAKKMLFKRLGAKRH